MSLAAKTYVITNGLPNDGSQVEQNFLDLINFMNGSMPHSDGTGGAADVRSLVFQAAGNNGKKLQTGTFDVTFSADTNVTGTLTYPVAFGSVPFLSMIVRAAANQRVVMGFNSDPTVTAVSWNAFVSTGQTITGTHRVYWFGIG